MAATSSTPVSPLLAGHNAERLLALSGERRVGDDRAVRSTIAGHHSIARRHSRLQSVEHTSEPHVRRDEQRERRAGGGHRRAHAAALRRQRLQLGARPAATDEAIRERRLSTATVANLFATADYSASLANAAGSPNCAKST